MNNTLRTLLEYFILSILLTFLSIVSIFYFFSIETNICGALVGAFASNGSFMVSGVISLTRLKNRLSV